MKATVGYHSVAWPLGYDFGNENPAPRYVSLVLFRRYPRWQALLQAPTHFNQSLVRVYAPKDCPSGVCICCAAIHIEASFLRTAREGPCPSGMVKKGTQLRGSRSQRQTEGQNPCLGSWSSDLLATSLPQSYYTVRDLPIRRCNTPIGTLSINVPSTCRQLADLESWRPASFWPGILSVI